MPPIFLTLSPAEQNALFDQGVYQFNTGHYFEAHESWEELWRPMPESPVRQTLQILIQMAVTLELVRRSIPAGVVRLHQRYTRRLGALPGDARTTDLTALAAAMDQFLRPILTASATHPRGGIFLDLTRAPRIGLVYNSSIALFGPGMFSLKGNRVPASD